MVRVSAVETENDRLTEIRLLQSKLAERGFSGFGDILRA